MWKIQNYFSLTFKTKDVGKGILNIELTDNI